VFEGGAFHGDKSALGWQTKQFNLSDYRGEDIHIKFNFCSDGSHVEEGWYIDDIKIYKYSASFSLPVADSYLVFWANFDMSDDSAISVYAQKKGADLNDADTIGLWGANGFAIMDGSARRSQSHGQH
jgi:hypothetical protein